MEQKESKTLSSKENEQIWRYIDFSKYIDLLITSELHFARADTFEDPFECSFSLFQDDNVRRTFLNNANIKEQYIQLHNFCQLFAYLNCWHINDVQSAALWKLYSENEYETIAIQSTFGKLKSELSSSQYRIHISKIHYDPENAGTPIPGNPTGKSFTGIDKITYKRKSFEHEKELRTFIYDADDEIKAIESKYEVEQLKIQRPNNIRIKINPSKLIENVYVGPFSKDWFVKLVENVSCKFGIDKNRVHRSNLYGLY
jgi:hypothetical protein